MKQGVDVNAVGSQGLDLSIEDIILPESREDRVPFIALQVIDGWGEFLVFSDLLVEESR